MRNLESASQTKVKYANTFTTMLINVRQVLVRARLLAVLLRIVCYLLPQELNRMSGSGLDEYVTAIIIEINGCTQQKINNKNQSLWKSIQSIAVTRWWAILPLRNTETERLIMKRNVNLSVFADPDLFVAICHRTKARHCRV